MPILSWEALNKILTDALRNYNELNAAMDLVSLFFLQIIHFEIDILTLKSDIFV
jgi:hypothetical protein